MDPGPEAGYVRMLEPRSEAWRSAAWGMGIFDTARRPFAALVEGRMRTPQHLLLVTLRGGARRLEVTTECGHRYDGADRAGAVSFVPAHCGRHLRMHGVRSEWASIAFRPEAMDAILGADARGPLAIAAFTNVEDGFLAGLVGEFRRHLDEDGTLDPLYADSMGIAAARYLARRFGRPATPAPAAKLAPWQLRRIEALVEARLGEEIRIAELAAAIGLSAGHFHRAFRATTGKTPLAHVTEARIRRAIGIAATEPLSVAELALRVGFASPSHFARLFRRATGVAPSRLRRG
ncbi:helix-turn-helix transcriptional regulator [Roseomonas hellenica]|uniref:Helix-turn-helix transcriptional regulator n=1 Tax=Plastoroseomonas hellenica TaxID=2687306 RepID=A0ABS5F5H6_9PROT|nr:AraC family transcriptional regulator [Plastoroseomonas hellenica]MBR0667380.1 helix-turn-helix transcriptional regulator [Plastoroseomonas hellenica]